MKNFEKPVCEVIRFSGSVITASGCGCFDGITDWVTVCTGDVGYCACEVNYNPAEENCTPCAENQGA